MFGREKRHDPVARHVASEIGHKMAQVVFLSCADGVVGEKDEGALLRETANSMIRVDPSVHSFACGELGTGRTQLRAEHGCAGSQGGDQIHLNLYYTMHLVTSAELRAALARVPSLPFAPQPSPIEPLPRLSAALGCGPRLLVKRDDAMPFAFGGNKVRKASLVAARAQTDGADTLITAGAIQSNHARVTAAAAAKLGMRAVLVVNGTPPPRATANALLDRLLGAEIVFVESRTDRATKMHEIADRLRRDGRRPFEIPVGASTPLGALAYVLAVAELADQVARPDVIVHATSSGGTQAGLTAGCRLLGWPTRVLGVSADES